MSHPQQIEFCKSIQALYPDFFAYKLVLDIGSLDINGNNRYLFEHCTYLGIDLADGSNVDFASTAGQLQLPDESIDTIISTECLEHDMYYKDTLRNMYRMLKPGGLLLFTCATEGRLEHGTSSKSPEDAPLLINFAEWSNYYKNLTEHDIQQVLDINSMFKECAFSVNHESHDLYFYGLKRGEFRQRKNQYYSANKLHETVLEFNNKLLIKDDIISTKNLLLERAINDLKAKEAIILEKDIFLIETDAMLSQQNMRIAEKENIITQKDVLLAEKDVFIAESDLRRAEQNVIIAEQNAVIAEQNAIVAEKTADIAESKAKIAEKNVIIVEKDILLVEKDMIIAEKDRFISQQNETLCRTMKIVQSLARMADNKSFLRKFIVLAKNKISHKHAIKICSSSHFFDREWYLDTYCDVREAKIDPIVHYVYAGAIECRDPGPNFSTLNYYIDNPKLIYTGVNPLVHFEKHRPKEVIIETTLADKNQVAKKPVSIVDNPAANKENIKLIAFYLPQFHTIAENDKWWGAGFTEWTNVRRATPMYEGHYQPHVPHSDIGYYDLSDESVLERQALLAKQYGIFGFCFYYYWFNGKRLLEMPLDRMLQSKKPNFPFCFCWANENWTRTWDGKDKQILIKQVHTIESDERFILDLIPVFLDERYIRIDGKPLLIVYRTEIMPNIKQTANLWRQICKDNQIGEIHLASVQSFNKDDPRTYGFDSSIQFPPLQSSVTKINNSFKPKLKPGFKGHVFDYRDAKRNFLQKDDDFAKYPLFRGVIPSWDNTARRMENGTVFVNSSPALYQEWLEETIEKTCNEQPSHQRLVFINAWNEWAEGAHLEPDEKHGYAYLKATQNAIWQKCNTPLLKASKSPNQSVVDMQWNRINKIFKTDVNRELYPFFVEYFALLSQAFNQGCIFSQEDGVFKASIGDSIILLENSKAMFQLSAAFGAKIEKFCFVVLQYNKLDLTKQCVSSLQALEHLGQDVHIVIVDNRSSDVIIAETQEYFKDMPNVTLLFNDTNSGYASGNNLGYAYAREKLCAEFIVIINNDTQIVDLDFIDKALNLFHEYSYSILGPDIICGDEHHNPWNDYIFNLCEWDELAALYREQQACFESTGKAAFCKIGKSSPTEALIKNPILQGAVYIFSPIFTKMESIAFEEETFLYGEELLLAIRCLLLGHLTLYNNDLRVFHAVGGSTSQLPSAVKYKIGYENAIIALDICLSRLERQVAAFEGKFCIVDSSNFDKLFLPCIKHVLVDLLFCQPGFHGGGEYGKAVFKGLLDKVVTRCDMQLWVALNPKLFIDDWILALCKQYAINIISVESYPEIASLVNSKKFYSFFAPAIVVYADGYEYMKSAGGALPFIEKHTKVIGALHDVRDFELEKNKKNAENLYAMYKSILENHCIHTLTTASLYSALSIRRNIVEVSENRLQVYYPPAKTKVSVEEFKHNKIDFSKNIFALIVNAARPEKNAVSVILAFEQLFDNPEFCESQKNLKVILVGISSLASLGLKKIKYPRAYILVPELSPKHLEFLYKNALFLIYASLNEGFGLPPHEAMFYGTPSIVSNITALPEVCGDAVIYCDPYNISSIKSAIQTMLINPPSEEIMQKRAEIVSQKQLRDLNSIVNLIID